MQSIWSGERPRSRTVYLLNGNSQIKREKDKVRVREKQGGSIILGKAAKKRAAGEPAVSDNYTQSTECLDSWILPVLGSAVPTEGHRGEQMNNKCMQSMFGGLIVHCKASWWQSGQCRVNLEQLVFPQSFCRLMPFQFQCTS